MLNLKSPTHWDGVTTFENYQGRCNRIPTEREIVESYYASMEFFKEREAWHQSTARWYFNYMREMEAKAGEHIELAQIAHANYSHYLDLIGAAYLNGFSFHPAKGVQDAA